MKSPTIFDQASMTSVSRKRSRSPKRCINFGTSSAGDCQRSGRVFLSGKPRHSAMTAARRDEFIKNYLATDGHRWNTDFKSCEAVDTTAATIFRNRLILSPHVAGQNI